MLIPSLHNATTNMSITNFQLTASSHICNCYIVYWQQRYVAYSTSDKHILQVTNEFKVLPNTYQVDSYAISVLKYVICWMGFLKN